MTAVLTSAEIEATRFHLNWGNIGVGGYPYTPEGFYELFEDVIAQYLTTGAETNASTSITADTITTVTPASMTDIVANVRLVIDTDTDQETVVVKSTTLTTFTARFAKAHAGTYPIAVESGLTRLRSLLADADAAFKALTSSDTGATSGLKRVDELEWYGNTKTGTNGVLEGKLNHYKAIVARISALVRVPVNCLDDSCGSTTIETY